MRIWAALFLGISLVLVALGTQVAADDDGDFTLWKSASFREVLDFSTGGDRLEQEEVADGDSLLSLKPQIHSHSDDDKPVVHPIELPTGFTNVDVYGLSDNGRVIGTATRPVGHPEGNQRGFVQDIRQDSTQLLRPPASYRGSTALDITSDGKTVCGLVIGRDPPRIQPAIWQQREGNWVCDTLPIDVLYNPFLVASRVAISGDGNRIVATVLTTSDEDDSLRNRICQWKLQADGSWSRRVLSNHAVHVADVNNEGMVAGRITQRGRRRGYVFDPDRGAHLLEPFPGDHNAEATAVNNHGIVVGISDDPPGPDGGTTAFVWRLGTMKEIEFPGEIIFSSARAILDNGQVGGWVLRRSPDDPNQVETGSFRLQLDLNTNEAKPPVR